MKNKIYFGGFRYHNYQMRGRNTRYTFTLKTSHNG